MLQLNKIQEKEKLVSYQEEIVKSSFFNNSVYGIDYVIKKQNSSGGEEDEIIQTKKYKNISAGSLTGGSFYAASL